MTRSIVYWIATVFIAANALAAGIMDIFRVQPFFGIVLHLGFPPYFASVIGVWKVLGAIALLAPRRPLVKEWAYAGMFIDFTSAMVAHVASGDAIFFFVGPVVSIGALIASWWLRPPSFKCGSGSRS